MILLRLVLLFTCSALTAGASPPAGKTNIASIDRAALVARHTVRLNGPDKLSPLSVGNGDFAFTVDITGLQTFPDFHADKGIPLGTQSNDAWHHAANAQNANLEDALVEFDFHGRRVPYLDRNPDAPEATDESTARARAAHEYFRANPHRFDLGRVSLVTQTADGTWSAPDITRCAAFRQELNLWNGLITSRFTLDGAPVEVKTCASPDGARVAIEIHLPGPRPHPVALRLAFPYPATGWRDSADWNAAEKHTTDWLKRRNGADFKRQLSGLGTGTHFTVSWDWEDATPLHQSGRHEFILPLPQDKPVGNVINFQCQPAAPGASVHPPSGFRDIAKHSADSWRRFWMDGGCIDLSGSSDPRWRELERRIVLSQYLTAVHSAGRMPPQETGLIFNSWHGKFHLEMHWWHAAHLTLWGREHLLARSMDYYRNILPAARRTARMQGFDGARWPKMTGPDGRESPSGIGVFLVWQQPHPIYLAELLYRATPRPEALASMSEIVDVTARFMASFAAPHEGCYVLGPTVIPAQECYRPQMHQTVNPTFELAYWSWALDTANRWRERLGLSRESKWDEVARGMARPHIRDGIYTAIAVPPFTRNIDHPSMLMALGFVPPTALVEPAIMRRTLEDVFQTWDWHDTWGWDFPMVAMTACRVGAPDDAIRALFLDSPKNRWLPNGHNWQDDRLPVYLPGNGALLYAAAMMAAGWDGAPAIHAPGFPQGSAWHVRHEGLRCAP